MFAFCGAGALHAEDYSHADSDSVSDSDSHADSDSVSDSDSNTDLYGDSDSNSLADSDGNSGSSSHADSDPIFDEVSDTNDVDCDSYEDADGDSDASSDAGSEGGVRRTNASGISVITSFLLFKALRNTFRKQKKIFWVNGKYFVTGKKWW